MKICPNCGKPPIEKGLISCHTCQVPFIEESERGLKLSKEELELISKSLVNSWRFWIKFSVAFLVALLVVGVPTVVVIGVHYATKNLNASLVDFNAQASNKLATAYQDVTNRISIAFQDYEQRADAQLAAAHQDIANRIAKDFEEPRIQEIVTQVAATQSSNLLSRKISPEIESFRIGTSNTLAQFDDSLKTFQKESTNALADVRAASEFAIIVAKAQNDDATAFDQLLLIANSGNSPFAQSALDIIRTIIEDVETDTKIKSGDAVVSFKWDLLGIDPNIAPLQQLKDLYSSSSTETVKRFNAVKQIFNNSRFSELDRFNFIGTVMQNDNSLRVRELCCDLMDTKANIHRSFASLNSYLQWLAKNRTSLTNNSSAIK